MSTSPILSISALNHLARDLIEDHFASVRVEGEISNLTQASSGHLYFTLKDASAQIKAVMFRGRRTQLRMQPSNGKKVIAEGQLSIYPARGDMQILVSQMQAAGLGDLHQAFMELKLRLQQEGLFARQRALPDNLHKLALVTSRQGAVIHDMLSILQRRAPEIRIDLYAVAVQGEGAALQLRQAIADISRRQEHDAVIIGRGGGSMEDLWAFNDEQLARAIAACPLPVISAVGHETDFSIADFAADLRAPTPSAAAELVSESAVRRRQRLHQLAGRLLAPRTLLERSMQRLDEQQLRLQQTAQAYLHRLTQRHRLLDSQLMRLSLPERLRMQQLQLQQAKTSLQQELERKLERHQQSLQFGRQRLLAQTPDLRLLRRTLNDQHQRLSALLQTQLQRRQERLQQLAQRAHLTSPLATLARGYSILFDEQGSIVRDSRSLRRGQKLQARLQHGSAELIVQSNPAVGEDSETQGGELC